MAATKRTVKWKSSVVSSEHSFLFAQWFHIFIFKWNRNFQIGGEDTNITFEDQQQINTFARKSARLQELKDEIEAKKVR